MRNAKWTSADKQLEIAWDQESGWVDIGFPERASGVDAIPRIRVPASTLDDVIEALETARDEARKAP